MSKERKTTKTNEPPSLTTDFALAGFFVFRTPLLPFAEFLAWGEGLAAIDAVGDATCLEETLAQDRARLRERLRAIFAQPELRDALFVASPDLDEFFDHWLTAPESKRGARVEGALVRYFARLATRPTPFGLFAGASRRCR